MIGAMSLEALHTESAMENRARYHIVSHSANEGGKYYRRTPNHRKASTKPVPWRREQLYHILSYSADEIGILGNIIGAH